MSEAGGPLEGLRVLDLSQGASGPYCTRLLALYGATVIKIERPGGGDVMRHLPPFVGDKPSADTSLSFLHLNVNKLGITLNLQADSGKAILRKLVTTADVVVESFRPGVMAALGFSYDELRALNPGIVLTSISNFGQTGPYRDLPASEIVLYGMGHEMFGTGQPDAEPMSMAPRVNLHFAGQTAAVATVGAVLGKESQGEGDWIDVAIMETYASSVDRRSISLTAYDYTGERMVRLASVSGLSAPPMFNICGDGYFHMSVGAPWWNAFVDAVDEDFLRTGRFDPPITDVLVREEFDSYWIPWCLARGKREIAELFQDRGMPVAPVNSVADLLTDPHLEIRGFFHELLHPVAGAGRYAGVPFLMHGTPGVVRTAAPQLGQHNAEIYGELGYSSDDLAVLAGAGVI